MMCNIVVAAAVLGVEELRDTRMQLWNDQRCSKDTVPGEITVNINSTMCAGFTFGRPTGCQVGT